VLHVSGFVVTSMTASKTKDVQNIVSDKPTVVASIVYPDLDSFLTLVTRETEIKAVMFSLHLILLSRP
jgi:hypothetical protein